MTPAATTPAAVAMCLLALPGIAHAQERPTLETIPADFHVGRMGYPAVSPFRGMRAVDGGLHVQVDDATWYELESINRIRAADLVSWCKRNIGEDRWWKRITEDLVEVLAATGNPAEDAVDLELRDLATGRVVTRRGVAMTAAKRRRLWHANKLDDDERSERPAPTTLAATSWQADLEQLEQLIDERYAYRALRDVDVSALIAEARERLGTESVRVADLGLAVERMLAAFGDGHTRVANARSFFARGYLPFLVAETADGLVALQADRSGFVAAEHPYLVALDGVPVDQWLDAARPFVAQSSPQFVRRHTVRMLRFVQFLRSQRGAPTTDKLQVVLRNGSGETETLALRVASRYPTYGDWPRTASRVLPGGIGYLRIPRMSSDPAFLDGIDAAMAQFEKTRGLIIDVRGNGGGSRAALRRLFPYFMSETDAPRVANVAAYRKQPEDDPHRAGGFLQNRWLYPANWPGWSERQRDAITRVAKAFEPDWRLPAGAFSGWHYFVIDRDANPAAYSYDRPVVVLMDGGCFSATDVFLGAFHGWRHVTLLGTASGGGSGRSLRYRLPGSGLELRLSSMASFRPNGQRYDGKGIQPDVSHVPVASDTTGETDTALSAAMSLIKG